MDDGLTLPAPEHGPLIGLTESYPHERPNPVGSYGAIEPEAVTLGPVDRSAQPLDENARVHGGTMLGSFADDYFSSMYLLPSSMNLGSATDVTLKTFHLWNARFTKSRLSQAVVTNTQGITMSGPPTPTDFARMAMKPYTLTVYPDGPTNIDARFKFHFTETTPQAFGRMSLLASLDSPPEPVELHVIGTRAELWMLPPNWSQRYDETYEFLTDIFTSRSGKEQRRALRNTPRKTINFQAIAEGDGLRWFGRMMAGLQANSFLLPDVTRDVRMTQPAGAGTVEIHVDGLADWFVPGDPVVLQFGNQRVARLIDDFTVNTLTLTTPLESAFPAGTIVSPGFAGRVAQQIRSTRLTNSVGIVNVVFEVTPLTERYTDRPAPTMWRDAEVFLVKPNYANPITVTNEWPIENVDFNRGAIKTFIPINFGTRSYQATYLGIGRDKVQAIVDTFLRAKGRRGEFYMPTWENDLPLREPLTQGSFRLRTIGDSAAKALHGNTVMKNLAVFTHDGQVYFNRVNSIAEYTDANGRDSLLTCEFAWPVSIPMSQVLYICWMPLCRFASDGLTVSWVSDQYANITPTIVSLEDKDMDQEL